jgi:NDP-sugar pyrophosphorylase family protein
MEYINIVILCGGKATRLGELTANKPKILVECDGKPFLDYLLNNIEWCLKKGVKEDQFGLATFVFATGTQDFRFYINEHVESTGYRHGNFLYITDGKQRVGTAGSLKRCDKYLNKYIDKTLVINGDSYISKHMLYEFIKDGVESEINSMLLGMPMSQEGHIYPEIVYDQNGIIKKYTPTDVPQKYSSAGYYMFNRSVIKDIPEDVEFSIESNVIPELTKWQQLEVFPIGYIEKFFDIGTPNGLAKFEEYIRYKKLIGEVVLCK